MTRDEIVSVIKEGCLEVLRDDQNQLGMFATFAYIGSRVNNSDVDATSIDITDFKDGTFIEVFDEFNDALIKFVENYK